MSLFVIYVLIKMMALMICRATPQKASQLHNALLKSNKLKLLIEYKLLATTI